MTVTSTVYTDHHITQPGTPLSVRMTIADSGNGNLTLLNGTEALLKIGVAHAGAVAALLTEASLLHDLLSLDGAGLVAQQSDGEPSDVREPRADERS